MSNNEMEDSSSPKKEEIMIKWEQIASTFSPKEREAVEYLRWMKNQICLNYKKVTYKEKESRELEAYLYFAWGAFVELVDVYKRRKTNLECFNKEYIEEQIIFMEENIEQTDQAMRDLQMYNLDILHKRLTTIEQMEKVNKRLELQLQVFENFFGLVSDHVLSLNSISYQLSIDFDLCFSKIKSTTDFIRETEILFNALLQKQANDTVEEI